MADFAGHPDPVDGRLHARPDRTLLVGGSTIARRSPSVTCSALLGRILVRTQRFGPLLVTAVVLAGLLLAGFLDYHGNPTGFIRFGRIFASVTHPPRGAVIDTRTGYDGQFAWAIARDPLMISQGDLAGFRAAGFRLGRIVYPALAFLAAAGQPNLLPWTLLAVNVLALLAMTAVLSRFCIRRGWSGWWGLCVGLLPGLQFATIGDLNGVLATALLLGGMIAWQSGRRWWAAVLLALAALAREPMTFGIVAIVIEAAWRWWPQRRRHECAYAALRRVTPLVAVAGAALLGWRLYVYLRHGASTMPPASAFSLPLVGLLKMYPRALAAGFTSTGIWDVAYLTAVLAAVGAGVAGVRREVTAATVAVVLFGLLALILPYGTEWGYTRESAPLFAMLLLAGLQGRFRFTMGLSVAVAGLGALVPLMVA